MKALVLGGAACVTDDAERALKLFEPDAVAAINDMIARWRGKIDYAVTLHPEKLDFWIKHRGIWGGDPGQFACWSHAYKSPLARRQFLTETRTTSDWGGSSGLMAVKVLLQEGFDKIVLAGVPMERTAGHVAKPGEWPQARAYQKAWKRRVPEIAWATRSMSGFTRDILGEPTEEWLQSETARPRSETAKNGGLRWQR